MKKILTAVIVITACAALFALVWPQSDNVVKVPAEAETTVINADMPTESAVKCSMPTSLADEVLAITATEIALPENLEITAEKEETAPDGEETQAEAITPTAPPAQTPQSIPASADPYHTDVYPNNVYSEELIYDEVGNLIGKTTTYPTAFGPDTIWIDGHAYYDLPGFGLVEWSGPSRRTEDYTMYESGVKVGIMGGEDEAPSSSTPTGHSTELPIPIEETIDQTINTRPERNSTPPDYKPELTPPADQNVRDIG